MATSAILIKHANDILNYKGLFIFASNTSEVSEK